MALLFKTNVIYTGVAEAKHILDLLITAQDKLDYAKTMLASIGVTSSYITTANIDAVVAKLIAHIRNVQSNGAQALSLPYTLKAIIFVMQNSLIDTEFTAVSPDFGVTYDSVNKYATKLFSLNGGTFLPYGTPRLKVDKSDGFNVLRQWNESAAICSMISNTALALTNGVIQGYCIDQSALVASEGILLHSSAAYSSIFAVRTQLVRLATAASATLNVPTTATTPALITVGKASNNFFRAAGVVSKHEYGTNLNKLFVNGVEEISNTGANIAFDLSALSAVIEIKSEAITNGIIEVWVINSKDNVLAKNLSEHLNRQNMLTI